MTPIENLAKDENAGAPKPPAPLDMLGFALRAARRHVRLGLSIAIGTTALGWAVSKAVPEKYAATSQILADETFSKTDALSTPDHAPLNLDPFTGSYELLTQKSVLNSIVDEAGLLANSEGKRPAWKRQIDGIIGRQPPTLEEKRQAMANVLAAQINFQKSKTLVTIRVVWPERRMAFRLAQLTYSKLIELVRNRDSATFTAAISILEDEARRASEAIEPALAEVVRGRDQDKQPHSTTTNTEDSTLTQSSTRVQAGAAPTPAPINEAAAAQARRYSAKLAEINRKIEATEDNWHRQQASLSAHLTELRAVYGQAHPQVVQQQAIIAAAREQPAELTELQRARSELLGEIQNVPEEGSSASTGRPRTVWRLMTSGRSERSATTGQLGATSAEENPEITASKAKLIRAVENYNNVAGRLASARLQYAAFESTFAMRFVVVAKPELPIAPIRPLRTMVQYTALFLGLISGLLAGSFRDLVTGIIYESAQLKTFGLKDLGELVVLDRVDR